MLASTNSSSIKNKKKLEPTITKPEITAKKSKQTTDKPETKIKIHEPTPKPHEPTSSKSVTRLKSPRQKIKRSYDKYIIDLKNYEIISQAKAGVIGVTHFIRNKKTNIRYTSKTSPTESNTQNSQLILREITLLIRVRHPTIIQIQGFSYEDFEGRKNITVLMSYIENGTLSDLIQKVNLSLFPTNYNNTKRQMILVGIARGMMILHKRHIIHRDLKPENILIESEFKPKITNFGLSKIFNSEEKLVTQIGSISYMAPEVFKNNRFSPKADVYSFGILMFELISNTRVYKSLFDSISFNLSSFIEKVVNGMRPEFTFPIKNGLKRMIESCWSQNPVDRPTFSELFCKLSLSDEEAFVDSEHSDQQKVINGENDDKMNFCLDDVNLEELFSYVDEVLDDERAAQSSQEDVEQLVEANSELAKSLSEQKSRISYLTKYVASLKDDNAKLKQENEMLGKENLRLETEISSLRGSATQRTFDGGDVMQTASSMRRVFDAGEENKASDANFSIRMNCESDQINPQNNGDQIITEKSREIESQISPQNNGDQIITEKSREIEIKDDQISLQNEKSIIQQISDRNEQLTAAANDQISTQSQHNVATPENSEISEKTADSKANLFHHFETSENSVTQNSADDFFQSILSEVKSGKVTTAILPPSLHSVPDGVFKFCRQLREVKIPESTTSIGAYAFYDCSLLSKVELPISTTTIGAYAFCLCSLLTSVTIPQNVASIGSHAFSRCSSLAAVTFPHKLQKIETSCFSWCTSLKSVTLPSSIQSIEDCTFFACCSLLTIQIPDSIEKVGCDSFYKCSSLQKVSIPKSVVSVGKGAFNGCLSLQNVVFESGSSLKNIGDYSFFECQALNGVEVPDSVRVVGAFAFGECSALLSAKVPSSVESIESNSFPSETKIVK